MKAGDTAKLTGIAANLLDDENLQTAWGSSRNSLDRQAEGQVFSNSCCRKTSPAAPATPPYPTRL